MNVPEALGKQYGPLPAGGWLLAAGAGVAVAVVVRRRAQAAPASAAELDATSLPGDNTSTAPGAGNLAGPSSDTTPATSSAAVALDNDTWRGVVERQLLAEHYAPILVDTALSHYLIGAPLPPAEQVVIARALLIGGPPPVAPPPITPGTPPPTYHPPATRHPVAKPAPKPATYVIRRGDKLADLARHLHITSAQVWERNHAALDAAARRHGRNDSAHGRYLYTGMTVHA